MAQTQPQGGVEASGRASPSSPEWKRWMRITWINVRELRAGLGREGLWALFTLALGLLVLATGVLVVIEKWPIRLPGPFSFRLTALGDFVDEIGLPWFWILFVGAVAIVGYWLSGQVDKSWLRGFVWCNLAIAGLLVIAVGRNVRVDAANDAARTDALQLEEIVKQREELLDEATVAQKESPLYLAAEERVATASALVACLDELGEAGPARVTCSLLDAGRRSQEAKDAMDNSLACLPGWTLGALVEWANEASYDRKAVSVTAVARCEVNAFDPGAELGEVTEEEARGIVVEAGDETGEAAAGGEGSTDGDGQSDDDDSADANSEEGEAAEGGEGSTDGDEQNGDEDSAAATSEQEAQAQAEIEARVDDVAQTQAAVDARLAVNEALATQRTQTTLYEAIIAGSDGILGALSGPTDFVEFRFSGATWLLILGLALMWYRKLEIRAGSRSLGPVDIVSEGADDGDENAPQSAGHAIFKQAVVQNVPEPGAVPGAQALAPVGDLVASSEVKQKKIIGSIVDLLQTIFATRSGYVVVFASHVENDTEQEANASDEASPTNVAFVRIRDRRTGRQLGSMRFASEYLEEAAQLAGYWVAGWIISRSRHVPSWAKWSETDARSFYGLQWRQGDDLPLQTRGAMDATAIDQSSVNSLILAQRAYAYQITSGEGGPYTFNALEDFARAVNRKPRYPVARYRRAAALSALMNPGIRLSEAFHPGAVEGPDPRPGDVKLPAKSRFRHLFVDLLGCESVDVETWMNDIYGDVDNKRDRFPDPMRDALLDKVVAWAAEGRAGVRAGLVAWLRPSEHLFWKDFSATGVRGDWMKLIRTSDYIAAQRRPGPRPVVGEDADGGSWSGKRLRKRARMPDSHWQISYNLACLHSLRDRGVGHEGASIDDSPDAKQAFEWLERCLDRPHSRQLVREWAERDPDLEPLRQRYPKDWERWISRVPRLPIVIRFGDRNHIVRQLQTWLDFLDPTTKLDDDGFFGPDTAEAIRGFQREHGLREDGKPDARTIAELEARYEARAARIGELLGRTGSPSGPATVDVLDEAGHLDDDAVSAVRAFQERCGLVTDGFPGPVTLTLLELEIEPTELRELLELCGTTGRRTPTAVRRPPSITATCVRRFQSEHGLRVDGVPGPVTIKALEDYRDGRANTRLLRVIYTYIWKQNGNGESPRSTSTTTSVGGESS